MAIDRWVPRKLKEKGEVYVYTHACNKTAKQRSPSDHNTLSTVEKKKKFRGERKQPFKFLKKGGFNIPKKNSKSDEDSNLKKISGKKEVKKKGR